MAAGTVPVEDRPDIAQIAGILGTQERDGNQHAGGETGVDSMKTLRHVFQALVVSGCNLLTLCAALFKLKLLNTIARPLLQGASPDHGIAQLTDNPAPSAERERPGGDFRRA